MKRFVMLFIVLVTTAFAQDAKIPELPKATPPRLSDADKLSLVIAQRDFYAAQAALNEVVAQCPNIDGARKTATKQRDHYQAVIDKLKMKEWTLNLDKLAYEEMKKP